MAVCAPSAVGAMPFDLLVHGGTVVTPGGVERIDVGISGERIVALATPGSFDLGLDAIKNIDAIGKLVIPGGIEPHAHCSFKFVYPWAQKDSVVGGNPTDVSRACAFGGTTTLLDFANWPGSGDLHSAVKDRDQLFHGACAIDYSFHVVIHGMGSPGNIDGDSIPRSIIDGVPDVVASGFPSFKVWTTDTTTTRPKQRANYGLIAELMAKLGPSGGVLAVHAEDDDLVMHAYRRFHESGKTELRHMPEIHSRMSEDLAVRRIIGLARWTATPVYIMHVSSREGVAAIEQAQQEGLPVYGETLHHFATFDSSVYATNEGPLYHTYPSLQGPEDTAALWQGLTDGGLSTLATDAILCDRAIKLRGTSIEDTVGGSPAVEERLMVAFTEGVKKRGMSLERFVAIVSSNAAKIFGLYPRKGAISLGSDADLVVFDPEVRRVFSADELHVADHSVWAGREMFGRPLYTILRGKVIVGDGAYLGEPGDGTLLDWRRISGQIMQPASISTR